MKRIGYLYEKVVDYDNIVAAMAEHDQKRPIHKRRGIDYRLAWEIKNRMQNDFKNLIGIPKKKTIVEYGKERKLQIPSYESCIAQIALWRICEPYVNSRIHSQSFACRKGFGGHLAAKKLERFVHQNIDKDAKYFLYFDIRHFYQHVDHEIVMENLKRIFKDQKILDMFQIIVDSSEEGLSIGYPFSHQLANLYLVPLYFKIRNIKNISKAYVYMDNWIVLSKYKKPLKKAIEEAHVWLKNVKCKVKGDWQIAPVKARAIKFCGFQISDKQTKLFKGNWKRTLKDFKKAKEGNEKAILSMQSRRGWLRAIRREFSNIFKLKNEKFLWKI